MSLEVFKVVCRRLLSYLFSKFLLKNSPNVFYAVEWGRIRWLEQDVYLFKGAEVPHVVAAMRLMVVPDNEHVLWLARNTT